MNTKIFRQPVFQRRLAPGLTFGLLAMMAPPLSAQMSEQPAVDYQMMDRNVSVPEGKHANTKKAKEEVIAKINRFRRKHELDSVQADPKLNKAAAMLADYMARTGRYGHTADGRRPSGRVQAAGYKYCLVRENIAYQYSSEGFEAKTLAKKFTQGWIDSKGHRKNILSEYATETGVAVARSSDTGAYYAVQLFARPRSASITCRIVNRSGQKRRYELALPGEASPLREFTLPPLATRVHQRCRPVVVTFPREERKIKVETSRVLRLSESEKGFAVKVESLKKEK